MKPIRRSVCAVLAAALLPITATMAAPAAAEDDPAVVQEVLDILKDRGLVDETRYTELVTKIGASSRSAKAIASEGRASSRWLPLWAETSSCA